MIPGRVSRCTEETIASTTSIAPQSDIVHVTGTTAIETILPPGPGFSCVLFLIPAAAFTTVTTGNIAIASTATTSQVMTMVFSFADNKWYPSY